MSAQQGDRVERKGAKYLCGHAPSLCISLCFSASQSPDIHRFLLELVWCLIKHLWVVWSQDRETLQQSNCGSSLQLEAPSLQAHVCLVQLLAHLNKRRKETERRKESQRIHSVPPASEHHLHINSFCVKSGFVHVVTLLLSCRFCHILYETRRRLVWTIF